MTDSNGTQTLETMSQAVWYNQWTVRKFEEYLKGEILEVGCGIGNFTKDLLRYGKVFAIDISGSYIEQTAQLVGDKSKVGLGDIEKGEYFFKDKQSLRSKDLKKFDCIVCLNVLEHIADDQRALKNMYDLLREEGYLILLVPVFKFLFGEIDKSIGHFRRYEKDDLKKMLNQTGFTIVKSRVINLLGAFGWWFSSRLFSNNKVGEKQIKLFNFIAPIVLPVEDIIEPPIGTSILIIARKEDL